MTVRQGCMTEGVLSLLTTGRGIFLREPLDSRGPVNCTVDVRPVVHAVRAPPPPHDTRLPRHSLRNIPGCSVAAGSLTVPDMCCEGACCRWKRLTRRRRRTRAGRRSG